MSAPLISTPDELLQPCRKLTMEKDDSSSSDSLIDERVTTPASNRHNSRSTTSSTMVDLWNLTLEQYRRCTPYMTHQMREHFLDQREPVPSLPPRFQVTEENPKPDLVLYGISADIDAIYAIAEDYLRSKGVPFDDDPNLFYLAVKLLNDACGVMHITAHPPIVPADDVDNWVVALYNNRNMASRGFPNEQEENRLVEIIQTQLHQSKPPQKLWMWAKSDCSLLPIH